MEKVANQNSTFTNVKNQLYATIIANWIVLSHGCVVGWLSPALPTLFSDDSPLTSGPLTHNQLSWISSMSSLGAIFGTFIFGILSSQLGPKRTMMTLAFPVIINWILVKFGDSYLHLVAGRLINGLTVGGMQSGVSLFVSQISNDDIRGRLGSITNLARNVGILVGYFVGATVDYENRPYIFVMFPVMFVFWIYSLPNTVEYYMWEKNYQKAETALMYYKGCNGNTEKEKSMLKDEFERLKAVIEERRLTEKHSLSDFCNAKAIKGIITSIAMAWFIQMTGSFVIMNYASIIFEKSGASLDSHIASIILAVMQIVAGILSTQFGDSFGRKTTLFISLTGAYVGMFTLALYTYLRHLGFDVSNFAWLPVVCLAFIIFISNAGIVALASVCAIENYPAKIRTAGVVVYSLSVSTVALFSDKYFPILMEVIHLHGCFLFFGICCCFGVVFVAFMKETKGKALDAIDEDDEKNNGESKI